MLLNAAVAAAAGIARALRRNGFAAYLVGGCVRDQLLGREPKDADVATSARPEQILALFPGSDPVGVQFGVVLVPSGELRVETATFRSDHDYSDGRRPASVTYESDPRQDALRRDFTINSLFLDPDSGEVLDFTGGRADLEAGVIRAIGEPAARFGEDHLRLLRAVRFAARLGFTIEPRTFAAIQDMRELVRTVAAERAREELNRILTEGSARRGFELLDSTGLLEPLLPEAAALKGVAQPPEYHPEGDVWTHTLLMLGHFDKLPDRPVTLALGILLHDIGKPATFRIADRIRFDGHPEAGVEIAAKILDRLRYSNDETRVVLSLIANHMRFLDAPRMRESTLKRFLRGEEFPKLLELHRIDCLSSHGKLDTFERIRDKLASLPEEVLRPPRLVTGDDLIAEGLTPGKQFREILTAVEDAQLEGVLSERDAALAWIRARYSPGK